MEFKTKGQPIYTPKPDQLEEENRILRETLEHLRQEIERYKDNPLMIAEVQEIFNNSAIIIIPNGNRFLVNISSECEKLASSDIVLVEQKNLTVIRKAPVSKKFNIEKFIIIEKPEIKWEDIGGLKDQAEEIREVIELPLKKPELFKKVGITPPKGILLYGPPGTGKTLLAKAVASSTESVFIELVGSELVQKYIGQGAKMVKEMFSLAKQKKSAVIFIDELDSIAAKRIELGTSGEREVQRTLMQLLAEIDGFDNLGNVKIIGCTNRKDILDPAILRPGRLDRQIEIKEPNMEGLIEIFKIHSKSMKINQVKPEEIVKEMKGFSGAEVKAVCTEAGYFAIREDRTTIGKEDLTKAVKKVRLMRDEEDAVPTMFG